MGVQKHVSLNPIKVREFQKGDEIQIDEIWRKHHAQDFSVPSRKNLIVERIAEVDGKIVAYGNVKIFAEAFILLDKDASVRDKVKALQILLLEAFRGADEHGLEDLYCFCKDPEFATLLAKHFSFEIVDEPGELLLRKV